MARPANPELRKKILKAAAEIIEGCGPDCVTMREVAEKVGYSPTTLYLYFKDKSAILREAVLAAFEELNDSCDMAMVGPGPLDKFRQRCRAYVVWGVLNPGHYALMFEVPWEMDWTVSWTEEDATRFVSGRVADLAVVAEAVDAGELDDETDLESFEDAVFAALHGATSLVISRRLETPRSANPSDLIARATAVSDELINALVSARQSRA